MDRSNFGFSATGAALPGAAMVSIGVAAIAGFVMEPITGTSPNGTLIIHIGDVGFILTRPVTITILALAMLTVISACRRGRAYEK